MPWGLNTVKIIIAGSRLIMDFMHVQRAIELAAFPVSLVVSGAARGVDTMGENWAKMCRIPVIRMPAQWRDKDGTLDKQAGLKRNSEMARYADGLIAVWDGRSTGTAHMIQQANHYGLAPFIYVYDARPGAVNQPKQWAPMDNFFSP